MDKYIYVCERLLDRPEYKDRKLTKLKVNRSLCVDEENQQKVLWYNSDCRSHVYLTIQEAIRKIHLLTLVS